MLYSRTNSILLKQLGEHITYRIKSPSNNVRLFYNDGTSVQHIAQHLHERHTKLVNMTPEEKSTSFIELTNRLMKPPEDPRELTFFNVKYWWRHMKLNAFKKSQKYSPMMQQVLGPDLAATYFVVLQGGRIRFKDHTDWLEGDESKLPVTRSVTHIVEAIDIKDMPLQYEGLGNMAALLRLKWLKLSGCEYLDDWCIDKISSEYPSLEYLDISECRKVTERGLEALYRMPNLQKLIVTNYYKSVAFELTCVMLEDVNPYLTCEIREPLAPIQKDGWD